MPKWFWFKLSAVKNTTPYSDVSYHQSHICINPLRYFATLLNSVCGLPCAKHITSFHTSASRITRAVCGKLLARMVAPLSLIKAQSLILCCWLRRAGLAQTCLVAPSVSNEPNFTQRALLLALQAFAPALNSWPSSFPQGTVFRQMVAAFICEQFAFEMMPISALSELPRLKLDFHVANAIYMAIFW